MPKGFCSHEWILHRTGDLSGTQAAGAGIHTLGGTVHNRLHTADVGLPGAVRPSVRVRHTDTKGNALAAIITFCHCSAPPSLCRLSAGIRK